MEVKSLAAMNIWPYRHFFLVKEPIKDNVDYAD